MIIFLLILIFLAILFPGFFRMVFAIIFILVVFGWILEAGAML